MPGISNVAVLLGSTVRPFEMAVYCEFFGSVRTLHGLPPVEFGAASEARGLARLDRADLVAIAPPVRPEPGISPEVGRALRRAADRGARIVAVSSAVFTLAAAGLLDGRPVAAGPADAAELTRRFPRARVTADVRYVDDDPIFTSAGARAAVDLCLHVIRKEQGARATTALAGLIRVASPRRRHRPIAVGPPLHRTRCAPRVR
jgi:transcriptional regulator GlxA family with amidase domain